MKKNFTLLLSMGFLGITMAQTVVTGPSSSQSPYLLPVNPGYTMTSVFTATQSIGNYTLSGIMDGVGAYDNNDGTFTMLINHEFGNTVGATRAHGSVGAFVSKWVINKTTYNVVSGSDLIQNVKLWTGTTYTTYNAANSSTLAAFNRFCSADLPDGSAFYNSFTGRGTKERIFMNGEEAGAEGRAFANIVTGAEAGTTYQLPHLGRFSWENSVASPYRSDKTIVIGTDDATPGQVYVYVGNKGTSGNDIQKAGLFGGLLYGVSVSGLTLEVSASFIAPNTTFSLTPLANPQSITGASLNTLSNNLGVTNFLRPEDGAWDPSNPRDFYFATTNAFNSPSRLYRLRFNDIENPELGGTITAVLDGTEGQQMMDNLGIDNSGHILIQEDPGNQAYIAKIWEYTIATDAMVQVAEHDPNRFLTGAPNFLTQDEESSGIIDVQSILGAGKFLYVDQTHYAIPSPVVEGGQILILNSQKTATSNPEVNVQGNSVNIAAGSTVISTSDNTNFGTINTGTSINKSFVIQNTGSGPLVVSSMMITGTNAGDFTFVSPPAFPLIIAANGSQTFTVSFSPAFTGTRNAMISVNNNDYSENLYDFAVQGTGAVPEINLQGNGQNIIDGSSSAASTNNTNFGTVILNNPAVTKTFLIQNTGSGTLNISGMTITGANASEFTFVNAPTFPFNLIGGASQSFTVQFLPTAVGSRTAIVTVNNSDADENAYDFLIEGAGVIDVGVSSLDKDKSSISIFPNPSNNEAVVKVQMTNTALVGIKLYSITGALVLNINEKELQKGDNHIIINTASLSNGEYFVKVENGDGAQTLKLVVVH